MNLQEALTFARSMSDAEDVSFTTMVTFTCEVEISMGNKPDKGVGVDLNLPEVDGITLIAPIEASYVAVEVGQPVNSLDVTLSADDVCKIFNIPEDADWEQASHGMFIG